MIEKVLRPEGRVELGSCMNPPFKGKKYWLIDVEEEPVRGASTWRATTPANQQSLLPYSSQRTSRKILV